ncbi:MAG TPA: PASTA domain-containing protein [Gaiellaceae bacterium]|nr:PASTA domain-containing protein [Gaiellaceae bacterium]
MPPSRHLRLLALMAGIGAVSAIGATVTLAAGGLHRVQQPHAVTAVKVPPLVVPDVRGQVYVYAKGILEDSGFAFRVKGSVKGYAANHVAAQAPSPGTRVVNTGAPTVILHLTGGSGVGEPQNVAPYPSTALRLYRSAALASAVVKVPARVTAAARAKALPVTTTKVKVTKTTKVTKTRAARPPAFVVPGARREPLNEIPLTERANLLDHWFASHPAHTSPNVRHWLYQHAWIVTGARFGWWHGDIALETLIATDRRVESQWGLGALSLQQARAALADVQARMRAG